MRRVLRNYLISFAIIGLFFLIVHLINTMVEQRTPPAPPGETAGAPADATE